MWRCRFSMLPLLSLKKPHNRKAGNKVGAWEQFFYKIANATQCAFPSAKREKENDA